MRLRLAIAYDGTEFHGWASQPGLRTVEGVVKDAIAAVFPHGERPAIAGRTDTGVHALANVASVDVDGGPPPERVAEALNAVLPPDVVIANVRSSTPSFNPSPSVSGLFGSVMVPAFWSVRELFRLNGQGS